MNRFKWEMFTFWDLEKDVHVNASASGVREFNIIPRSGAASQPGTTEGLIALEEADSYAPENIQFRPKNLVMSFPGDVNLSAKLGATNSTLTVEGDMMGIIPGSEIVTNQVSFDPVDPVDPAATPIRPRTPMPLPIPDATVGSDSISTPEETSPSPPSKGSEGISSHPLELRDCSTLGAISKPIPATRTST